MSVGHRSAGTHISTVYNDLYQRLEPKRFTGGKPDPVRLEAGLSFENMIEQEMAKRLSAFRPGEIVTPEGIIMSPDLILLNGHARVGELKLTWLSMKEMPTAPTNGVPPKFEKYLTQLKAYCHGMSVREARLIVYFVNGDYRPMMPCLKAYDIEFTQRELDENWTMLMRHAKSMGLI